MSTYERVEYRRYTKTDIENALKFNAQLALIGTVYYGVIGEQEVRWCEDGSIEIFTHHTPDKKFSTK